MTRRVAEKAVTGGRGRGPRGRLATLSSGVAWCPILACREQIDPSRLMCRNHWYLVPKSLRDQVWATWRSGQGADSGDHRRVVCAAIAAVQEARPVRAGTRRRS